MIEFFTLVGIIATVVGVGAIIIGGVQLVIDFYQLKGQVGYLHRVFVKHEKEEEERLTGE